METRDRLAVAVVCGVLAVVGCDGSTAPGGSAQATARFYNGPTTAGVSSAAERRAVLAAANMPRQSTPAAQPQQNCSAKCWFLSPDKITMTLTSIQPVSSDSASAPLISVNCPVTYNKANPGLTQLADCPFTLPAGTYSALTLTVSATMQVLISDSVAGFYTTASGIVTSPPSGGAQPLTVTIGTTNANELQEPNVLPSPVQISSSTPVTFSVIVNGLQSFKVAVNSGGAVTLGWPGTSYSDSGRPDWAVAVGGVASVAFYASQALGTAGSFCAGGCTAPTGILSVSVYNGGPTTPEMVAIPVNGPPSGCGPFGLSWIVDSRSYLGLDGAGNVSWAIPTDATYSTYAVEMQMAQVSTIGASTMLYCKNITSDPKPTGGSFASGAPGIASPANLLGTYILLAH